MNIKDMPTCELVKELLKREGVEHKIAEPYKTESIQAEGPAILVKIID